MSGQKGVKNVGYLMKRKESTKTKKCKFKGCKNSENDMLVSALRRLEIKGYLPEIYGRPPKNDN